MQIYIHAYEGDNQSPSFTLGFNDLLGSMSDGLAINSIGHLAAREQRNWSEDRIASARWAVVRRV